MSSQKFYIFGGFMFMLSVRFRFLRSNVTGCPVFCSEFGALGFRVLDLGFRAFGILGLP